MSFRLRAMFPLVLSVIVGAAHVAVAQTRSPEETLLGSVKNGPLQKLGPWLANLSDEFRQAPNKDAFQTRNPVLKVNGGRVAIDLYANDPAALQAALATLGAANVTV